MLSSAAVRGLALLLRRRQRRRKKRLWIKDWLRRRSIRGSYSHIFRELNDKDFCNYLRMPPRIFHFILEKIKPIISRQNTHFRECVPAGSRLEASLLFLATGASFSRIQYHTRISRSLLSTVIPQTCQAIYETLKDQYLKVRSYLTILMYIF